MKGTQVPGMSAQHVRIDVKGSKGKSIGVVSVNLLCVAARYEEVARFFRNMRLEDGLSGEQLAREVRRLNDAIKEKVDYLCGGPVSSVLFGRYEPLTEYEGILFFEYVLEQIGRVIESAHPPRHKKRRR